MGARKADPGDSDPGGSGGSRGGEDYLSKRARNNEAVKRSREKARQKAKETHDRVTKLKNENEMLEERIKLLSKELTFLKDIFLAHAGSSHGLCIDDLDINSLLREEEDSSEMSTNGAQGDSQPQVSMDFDPNASDSSGLP